MLHEVGIVEGLAEASILHLAFKTNQGQCNNPPFVKLRVCVYVGLLWTSIPKTLVLQLLMCLLCAFLTSTQMSRLLKQFTH